MEEVVRRSISLFDVGKVEGKQHFSVPVDESVSKRYFLLDLAEIDAPPGRQLVRIGRYANAGAHLQHTAVNGCIWGPKWIAKDGVVGEMLRTSSNALADSNTVTRCPSFASASEVCRPPMPAPTTTTWRSFMLSNAVMSRARTDSPLAEDDSRKI